MEHLSFFPYIFIPSLKFGIFSIEAFGTLVAIGIVVGAYLIKRRALTLKADLDIILDGYIWILPGGFIISHWVSLFLYFPERVAENPLTIVYFWAGISSFGGILGGMLIAAIYLKKKGLSKEELGKYLDIYAYGFIPGFAIGRLGCTVAHDHPGLFLPRNPTSPMDIAVKAGEIISLPPVGSKTYWIWLAIFALVGAIVAALFTRKRFFSLAGLVGAIAGGGLVAAVYPVLPKLMKIFAIPYPIGKFYSYTKQLPFLLIWGDFSVQLKVGDSVQTVNFVTRLAYDLGLAEAIYFFFFLAAMFTWTAIRRDFKGGEIITFWFITYPPIRFLLDYLRVQDKRYWGLTPGQYMCFLMFGVGLYFFFKLTRQPSPQK